ncbi:transcriptional regulator protein [Rhizobium phaseoli]|uniref:helix-turn-helix transcriptional regulator n=1 Tax=Rhizobium phaseoli TaxID=396 RepID=UPI0007EBB301|nr:helix-turn-helix domain-containing protein [Rhizobium phaseoli]ANL74063.1 transcriptional regulator protein [Rhizobium phaseoli]
MVILPSISDRRMLRTDDAAKLIGLSPSTLAKFRLNGGGPRYIKLGRSVVYDPADVEAWLCKHRRSSTSVHRDAEAAVPPESYGELRNKGFADE